MLYLRWRKARRRLLTGAAFKPPYGAVAKSHGIERLGKRRRKMRQVRIEETNASESLMRCRDPKHVVKTIVPDTTIG